MISSKKSIETVPRQQCSLLGVPFHSIAEQEWKELLATYLCQDDLLIIFTPNPEIMLRAIKDEKYLSILQQVGLSLPDGQGLRQMTSFLHRAEGIDNKFQVISQWCMSYLHTLCAPRYIDYPIDRVIAGSDTLFRIHKALPNETKIHYFGGEGDVPTQMLEVMNKNYPGYQLTSSGGYPYRSQSEMVKVMSDIKAASPEVLFVALPFPLQERFVIENKHYFQKIGIKVVMVVGGSFDFAVGKIKRAPLWMRRSRLEWLWRVIQEPKRVARIFDAVFAFPYMILRRRLAGKDDLLLPKL